MLRRLLKPIRELYDGYMNFGKEELEAIRKLQAQQQKELEYAKRLHDGFDARSEDARMEALRSGMKTLQDAEGVMEEVEREASIKIKEMLDRAIPDPVPMTAANMKEMKEKLASEKSIGEFLKTKLGETKLGETRTPPKKE